jgi:predicted transcriptional regulator
MMDRRSFLAALAIAGSVVALPAQNLVRSRKRDSDKDATSRYIFNQAMRQARQEKWHTRPIGEIMGLLGMLLVGTPYVGGTLEGEGPEVCRVDLTGLDCVTYFENTLCMARIIQKQKYTYEDLIAEITMTRYKNGVLDGYSSRLHYTSAWIDDNVKKGVITDVTPDLNGVAFAPNVSFMTTHPEYYAPLKNDSVMIRKVSVQEAEVNAQPRTYIPKDSIESEEARIQTGDIIAIATSKAGLDYAHTGMAYRDDKGVTRLLHASTQKKKVTLDRSISEYVGSVKTHTGITVVRPRDMR